MPEDFRHSALDRLGGLISELERGAFSRLRVQPGAVLADRGSDESLALDVGWTDDDHATVKRACAAAPLRLAAGHVVRACGDVLVVRAAPDATRGSGVLIREGRLSALACRLLGAALAMRRNVLLLGPHDACVELGFGLVADGLRPAVLGGPADPVPSGWPLAASLDELVLLAPDRIAALGLRGEELTQAMGELSGVVGWIDAPTLARGLMRFEAAREARTGRSSNPLHVLAAVDLVVVMAGGGVAARPMQVAEVLMADEGYRLSMLFSTGVGPAPHALVPLAPPSFLPDLDQHGHAVLADELRYATVETSEAAPSRSRGAARRLHQPSDPVVEPAQSPRRAPAATLGLGLDMGDLAATEPPGWELDELSEVSPGVDEPLERSSDAAAMAATYGLDPPPPPPGGGGVGDDGGTFAEALRRAKQRDVELAEAEVDEEA